METISHRSTRRKSSATKTNIIISVVVHVILFLGVGFWAASQGYFGEKAKDLSVSLVRGEKEKVKAAKKDEPKEVVKKVDVAKVIEQAKAAAPTTARFVPPPPPVDLGNAAPPPPVIDSGAFVFGDEILGSADPVANYKTQIENVLRAKWQRPADVADNGFVAEVETRLDTAGKIVSYEWKKGSGNDRWDTSVKQVMAGATTVGKAPPKGFPDKVVIRFDVVEEKEIPVGMQ
ncbi:MAG: TonB C-terminal domain-containing protein [Verrucomicrobiota bacterium]